MFASLLWTSQTPQHRQHTESRIIQVRNYYSPPIPIKKVILTVCVFVSLLWPSQTPQHHQHTESQIVQENYKYLPITIKKVILTVRILACGNTPLELLPISLLRTLLGFGEPFDEYPTIIICITKNEN